MLFDEKYIALSEAQDFMLYVIPWYKCNLRCDYCFVPKYDTVAISKEVIYAASHFLKNFIKSKNPVVSILWGEPFLYFDKIIEIISIIQEENPQVSFVINTNGNLIQSHQLEKLGNLSKKITLIFSIDWNIEAMDTRLNGSMEQVWWQLQRILNIFNEAKKYIGRDNIEITMTISKKHLKSLDENLQFVTSLNPWLMRYRLASWELWTLAHIDFFLKIIQKWFFKYITHKLTKNLDKFPKVEQFEKDFIVNKHDKWWFYPCSKWLNLTLTPEWTFVPCYNFLSHEDQVTYWYRQTILDYHNNQFDLQEFSNWRMQSLNLNNDLSSDGEPLKTKVNYSKCLTKWFSYDKIELIKSALLAKDAGERKIWLLACDFFQKNYNIDLTGL